MQAVVVIRSRFFGQVRVPMHTTTVSTRSTPAGHGSVIAIADYLTLASYIELYATLRTDPSS